MEVKEHEIKKKKLTKIKYYEIDITDIPSAVFSVNKFMTLHPEFFKTNVSKKMIYINDTVYNIYKDPVHFKDKIHNVNGYITTLNNQMIIHIKYIHKTEVSYVKQIESYVSNHSKHGNSVELYYNKILSDCIVKYVFYNQPTFQWVKDVETLQKEFFSPERDKMLAIINNKTGSELIGNTTSSWNNIILHGPYGSGKCLALDTPVLMYDGSIKKVQDISKNDIVMGDDSTPRKVLSYTQGKDEMFEIRQGDDSYTVNKAHILSLVNIDNEYIDISVEKYLLLSDDDKEKLFGYKTGVEFEEKKLDLDPYILGTSLDNKKIPKDYKINSRENRLKLLAGLIDKCNGYEIMQKNTELAEDIVFLCKSLGFKTEVSKVLYAEEIHNRIIIKQHTLREPITVTSKGNGGYYGFELNGNHRFVLGNFIVTHNSSFIYRTAMTLKLSILSVDLSLYLNKKKELYSMFHNQEFALPGGEAGNQPAMTNCVIVLEEFDSSVEKLLDIENIFKYKNILTRNYLDLKNKEIKEKAASFTFKDDNDEITPITKKPLTYEEQMEQDMLADGFDIKNNKVMDSSRMSVLGMRSHDNEMHSISAELNNIIKEMDTDNKSNILRLSDLLELFQSPIPVKNRLIIATTNNFNKIKTCLPALFRAGRMTAVEFNYLDWASLNQLTQYYFNKDMTEQFQIKIPTSQVIELAIKYVLCKKDFALFETELKSLC